MTFLLNSSFTKVHTPTLISGTYVVTLESLQIIKTGAITMEPHMKTVGHIHTTDSCSTKERCQKKNGIMWEKFPN